MHKCVVCGNNSQKTRYTRPQVIYHSFPKNEYRRKKWLKTLGITVCHDWHRVCSDHFLKTDYKPDKTRHLRPNTIPRPLDQTHNENQFPNNIQNDGEETENSDCLSINQDLLIEEQIEETVVNNFESPRRSSRKIKLTTTNEDMSYENMPRLQTERLEKKISTYIPNNVASENNLSVPILPAYKDHSLGNGIRCSIKSCNNRYSKYLSFFGYPSDLEIRKKWFEKCGLKGVDPTSKLKSSLKVCRQHFDEDCFLNSEKRNRLKSDAVPTLFLDNDKPSCSSSNYSTNEETDKPLTYMMDTPDILNKDSNNFECCIPGCSTNSNEDTINSNDVYVSLFKPPDESVNDWSSVLGMQITENSIVCGNHFRPQDICSSTLNICGVDQVIKTLTANALPLPINVNAMQSATTTKLIKTNDVPVLKTYEGRYKRLRANKNEKHLPAKKPRKSLMNESNTTTEAIYISENENNIYIPTTNYTHEYASSNDLNPTLESNTSNSSFKEVLPKILANSSLSISFPSNNEQIMSKQISAIDDNKELIFSYNNKPILKQALTNNGPNVYMCPTTSDYASNIEPSVRKTYPINVSNMSQTNIVKPAKTVDLSIVKIEPNDDNMSDSLQTNFEQITETHNSMYNNLQSNLIQNEQNIIYPTINIPTTESIIKPEPVEYHDDLLSPLTSIDDSSFHINLSERLKDIKVSKSLSISLDKGKNTKVIKPPVKTSGIKPKSITLQSRSDHNLSLVTHNSSLPITLISNCPSTSSNSMYNISLHSSTQYNQEPISTLNNLNQLSPNTEVHPKCNQIMQIISPPIIHNLPILPEIRNPFNCEPIPNDSNSNHIAKTSSSNVGITRIEIEEMDNGFIHEVSKSLTLPSVFWSSIHDTRRNSTIFIQRDDFNETVKKINFTNSLTPTIQMYGKKYEYYTPIKTKIELETLLEKIDNFEKCSGNDGFTHENCIGYFEARSEDVEMCSVCQQLIKHQDLFKTKTIIESKSKTIANLKNKIFERKLRVFEARKKLEKLKKKRNH
ncbi:uncharacterized protein LOC112597772 isoform X2 [Melanaphis sacchari]|uniref:uncharacterized protein LOC112597772 isoform X2 n=1 Tax=Melanaphis sacchari TaxID=742174 RepID=UPI000DC151D2|nr:uncharacterized protein LOC112597772 isoform X2 [Melanaphis sacchari]